MIFKCEVKNCSQRIISKNIGEYCSPDCLYRKFYLRGRKNLINGIILGFKEDYFKNQKVNIDEIIKSLEDLNK